MVETEAFQDLVILQTVLDEVRNRSPSVYQRVRAMIARDAKRCYVFSNEHHRETYAADTEAGESMNDRNDRAIRLAAAWYQRHLGAQGAPFSQVRVVMLSNDAGNRERARREAAGYVAAGLGEYCGGLEAGGMLMEMLETAGDADAADGPGDVLYPEDHLSEAQIRALLDTGKLLRGTLHASSYNAMEGVVFTGLEQSGELGSIQIHGRAAMNRAIHGDSVAVLLLPREQWDVPAAAPEGPAEGGIQSALIVGDEADNPQVAVGRPRGRIVGIVGRKWKAYCGSIDRKGIRADASTQYVLFCPMDRRIPRIRLRTRQAAELATQRILVAVDGWDRKSANPHGHLVRQLGPAGDRATETEAILLEHDVAHADWTPQILACLPAAGPDWAWTDADMAGRADLRGLDVCSIDPPGCTDIDDALHAVRLPSGNLEVGVHIADVTHFVAPATPLDSEAAARGTTVYLVDRRIDMLPPLLGTNLCSLRADVDRFAFSCIWEMTPDAQVVSTRFTKSVIRSRASFTYDMAQERLDTGAPADALTASIQALHALARILKARRTAAGALVLASPEVRFQLDRETQNPVDVELKEMKAANSLVEEFMLLANISVAQQLYQHFPDTAILRRHPAPPADNFEALNRALAGRNPAWCLDVASSGALAQSLDRAADPADPYLNKLVRIMATRCMLQAQYFASGAQPYAGFWHYGLACPIYTHFTSPIRRYADVLVHRLLHASIDPARRGSAISWDKQRGEDLCHNLNYRNRMAQQAQRSSVELYTQLYFKGKTLSADAYVIKIMAAGIVVLIPSYGIEGMVPIAQDGPLAYDPAESVFVDRATRAPVAGLFQHVHIAIRTETHAVSQREKLIIELVDQPAGPPAGQIADDSHPGKRPKSSP